MPSFGQRVQPAVGEQDLLGLSGVDDHQHHHLGARHRLFGRARRRPAGLGQRIQGRPAKIEAADGESRRATRFFAIGKPIEPSPMKATEVIGERPGKRASAADAIWHRSPPHLGAR